jgi:predicted dehydrogenase
MGHMHAQCYTATGEAKVVALADIDAAKREEAVEKLGCSTYANINDMLAAEELDIVDICLPTFLHEECVIAASGKVKTVICEKPMSLSVESCTRMIEETKKNGTRFMVAQVLRFWPEYMVIKELVASGKFGKIVWMSAQRRSSWPTSWENWYADPAKSGGAVLDLHIHDEDTFAWLIGSPKKIDARGQTGPGAGINSVQVLGWDYENGAKTYAEGALNLGTGFPFNMALMVACEKATIKFDMSSNPALMVYPFEGEAFEPEVPKPSVGKSTETSGNVSDLGGYFNEIQYLIECVKADKPITVVTPEDARESVRICLAVEKSAKINQVVEL